MLSPLPFPGWPHGSSGPSGPPSLREGPGRRLVATTKEVPKADTRRLIRVEAILERGQPRLDGPQGPARIAGKVYKRCSFEIQRADVTALDRLSALTGVFEPAQWKPLGAADVGPLAIDPTTPICVEKSASTRGMGLFVRQQFGVSQADVRGFDFED